MIMKVTSDTIIVGKETTGADGLEKVKLITRNGQASYRPDKYVISISALCFTLDCYL